MLSLRDCSLFYLAHSPLLVFKRSDTNNPPIHRAQVNPCFLAHEHVLLVPFQPDLKQRLPEREQRQ